MRLLILTFFLFFLSCQNSSELTEQPSVSNSSEAVRLTAFMPLTGSYSSAGDYIRSGLDRYVKEHPQENIQIDYQDVCLAKSANDAYKKTFSNNPPEAIIANYCVLAVYAIKDYLKKDQVITVQQSLYPEELASDYDNIYSLFPSIQTEAATIAKHFQKNAYKKIAVFFLTSQWGEDYYRSLKQALSEETGIEIVSVFEHQLSENDFKTELIKTKSMNLDAIFIAHVGSELINLTKQAAQLGIEAELYTSSEGYDQTVQQEIHGSARLTMFVPYAGQLPQSSGYISPLEHNSYLTLVNYMKYRKSCLKDSPSAPKTLQNCLREKLQVF